MPDNNKVPNLASTYAKVVMERFSKDSLTQGSFSTELDVEFTGVKTVRVYEIDVAEMNDYTRSGANRYGTPKDLGDSLQEFMMERDRAFTFVIDKGNAMEQFNQKQAGTALKRQIREVITPEIDKYRLKKWAENAGTIMGVDAPTKSTIGSMLLDASAAMDDALVPSEGRILYVTPNIYKLLKLCDEFTHSDTLTARAIGKGYVGEFDGMQVRKVPTSYMPANVCFMIVRKDAAIGPVKLSDYKVHTDPPGYSGDLVEGRVIYDAFVKGPRAKGIYVCAASASVVATPTVAIASNVATLTSSTASATIYYTDDGTDPTYSTTVKTYDSSSKPTLAAGATIRCYATKAGMYKSGVAESVNA